MEERIANSRIQATLNAINQTIDKLMAQNPQNRVAVCGYGANAVVLMPLGHYKRVDKDNDGKGDPYLSVGGMETLYHPSDLVYRSKEEVDTVKKNGESLPKVDEDGWYWMNNRDTCYTVVVNAEYNTYTGVLDDDGEAPNAVQDETTYHWQDINTTVSNNVLSDDGEQVKAFPGEWANGEPTDTHGELSQTVYTNSSSNDENVAKKWVGGLNGVINSGGMEDPVTHNQTSALKEAMKPTSGLTADDYVGYFTNTQGGIYLAYKQLADSEATTYTETLTNGVVSTVARIPAAIIMSDGGANFSFNEMGQDGQSYTAKDWNARYGQRAVNEGKLQLDYITDDTWTNGKTPGWNNGLVDGRYLDYEHRLNQNSGNEWYKVFIPGEDTLKGWDGLHGIYNQGADITEDGTLSTPPTWNKPGVFYSSDNSPVDAPGTILEVLLTAAYMHDVVKTHYNNGWTADGATEESKSDLFTYTMNVDTKHVPQWGKMRLYPTLDPKDYPLDTIKSAKWYTKTEQFGGENLADGHTLTSVYEDLYDSWIAWKTDGETKATISDIDNAKVQIKSIVKVAESAGASADYATKLKKKDGTTQDDTIQVTDKDVVNNIAYNDDFFDVTSGQMDETFDKILALILGNVFVPVSGDNDAGVGDSITYQDPIGEYMEIKNQAIIATPHHVGDPEVGKNGEQTYDMSMLLFGEMHGLVRAGVYDWNWNNKWMELNKKAEQGKTAFPMGWYKGEPKAGQQALSSGYLTQDADGSSTYPSCDYPNTGKTYNSAQDARNDGWVYRFNFQTLLSFVPIIGLESTDQSVHPEDLPAQVKNTVYTCYRFAGSQDDRNELRRNPIYGEIPEEIQTTWNTYVQNHGYPTDTFDVEGIDATETPGLYRLSDIRVWVEDTGDFVDTTGAITPNSGYDRSLYVNVPAVAIPTELATITLGRDGVLSYETNLGKDHPNGTTRTENGKTVTTTYEQYCYQSTPLRLFYAVGLEEDLILRDSEGNQQGVDFNAISAEYINSHTVEGQDYVWFISNFYSGTRYDNYTTDDTARTRGDPTVTFSPSADNRYYVFQKPLPLYAHAYRVDGGTLKPVDKTDAQTWGDNKSGNGTTTWEIYNGTAQQAGSWVGGQYMGTYKDEAAFKDACSNTTTSASISPGEIGMPKTERVITDSNGIKYQYVEGGIVFLEDDLLDHVTSDTNGGYTKDSVSFSSDDYFFILVEFYVPDEGTGVDDVGEDVPGTQGGHMVQYALARKGSEFGSGFASDAINNGDMLCWTDTNNKLNVEFAYVSKTDTGDRTRGEPTWEKLTYQKNGPEGKNLGTYLAGLGLTDDKKVPNPDFKPSEPANLDTNPETIGALTQQVNYWTEVQADRLVQAALNAANTDVQDDLTEAEFEQAFKFAVAARPGGVRPGDMSNNLQYKGTEYDGETQLYNNNATKTSNTYYLPTISDSSGTDNNVIINNYLGNNGRLEIANQMLHVTKMLEAPAGYTLTENQKKESFNYQIFVQGVSGTRTAVRTEYNEYSKTWERELGYIDVLTDNSDLVQTNNNTRALFVLETTASTLGGDSEIPLAKQVILNTDDGKYYYANDDGTQSNTVVSENSTAPTLYYMYLPSNAKDENSRHVHRLYQNADYKGDDAGNFDLLDSKDGTTTFVDKAHEDEVTESTSGNLDSKRLEDGDQRPAGTKTYWAQDAELIPVSEVQDAEAATISSSDPGSMSGIATMALESISGGTWTHTAHAGGEGNHKDLTFHTFVIRKPNGETSATNFTSPYATRSQYLTEELKFGQNANVGDGGTSGDAGSMQVGDLYDKIVPSGDRPDLFTGQNADADYIARHTAEFTLHHGEGLLLTGLDNRIAYRFTEKLTQDQLDNGYTLQKISHIQQRGSESIYRLGIQEIPIYSYDDATYGSEYGSAANSLTENGLTWAVDENGNTNPNVEPHNEPFAHTNAVMWEYYATMANGASGNHHQPAGVNAETESSMQIWDGSNANTYTATGVSHTVADNPNCKPWNDATKTGCDVTQGDSILHYMYREGVLIDPHYNGEASTYMRNMARYGVSPTVHFAVEKEPDQATVPSILTGEPTYTGVYSVFGNTGWFEEQANFTNTFEPGTLSITKELEAATGTEITEQDKQTEFDFMLKLDTASGVGTSSGVYNYTITATSEATGEPGTSGTPAEPTTVKGRLLPNGYSGMPEKTDKDIEADTDGTWHFTLKGGETMTVTGLPVDAGYTYTVKELTPDGGYDVKDNEEIVPDDDEKTVSGTVPPNSGTPVKVVFTNTKKKPEPTTIDLKLQKTVTGTGFVWDASKSFTFLVRPVAGNPEGDPITSWSGWNTDNGYLPVTVTGPTTTGLTSDPVNVFGDMKFANVGTYRYTISEQTSNIPGISSDGKIYNVQVDVSEDYTAAGVYTGKLKADVTVDGEPHTTGDPLTVTFNNTYNEKEIELPFKARKVLKGGALEANKFEFELKSKNFEEPAGGTSSTSGGEPMPISGGTPFSPAFNLQLSNNADGTVDFGSIRFTDPGTYTFEMREIDDGKPNITYDKTVYTITVVISRDAATNALTLGSITYSPDVPPEFDMPTFTNEVIGGLTINKTVTGTEGDKEKDFNFTVKFDPDPPATGVEVTKRDKEGTEASEQPVIEGNTLTFTLKDGEFVDITGLPIDTGYTVTETEANEDGYTTTVTVNGAATSNGTGSIGTGSSTVEFVNDKGPEPETGNLQVTKTVTGTGGDKTKDFHFTVTLSDKSVNGTYGNMTFTDGVATFNLTDGQSATATGLPAGITYTVTETEANADGYTTDVYGDAEGVIPPNATAKVDYINRKDNPEEHFGNLVVSKTVTGTGGDKTKAFHFTVTLSDTDVNGTFGDMTFTNGVAEFTLRHDESATANNLPAGLGYTVTEQEANTDGYTTVPNGEEGAIPADGTAYSKFVNDKRPEPEPKTGGLVVAKIVTGNGDKTKAFNFTVTLGDTTITGEYGEMTFTDGVATFTLKHGESVTATGLPEGITYTVTETEANTDGYTTTSDGETGTIPAGGVAHANFENRLGSESDTGGLVVTKTVTGDGDKGKVFNFTVTLSDTSVNGTYGDMIFADGVATFTLKHGESVTATGLPDGITYTVTEEEADEDGYTTSSTGASGTIPDGGTARAAFVNGKTPPPPEDDSGNLTVTKTVTGSAGDTAKEWHFTVTLDDTGVNGEYGGMTFTNGVAAFTLKHGESRTATGLHTGVTYTVTEQEANEDGYTTTASGVSGTITDGGTGYASFVNDRNDETPPPPTEPPTEPPVEQPPTEQPPTEQPPVEPPKTGDDSRLGLWMSLMIPSLIGVVLTSVSLVKGERLAEDKGRHVKK